MRCENCQSELRFGARFCADCGARQPLRCAACGTPAEKEGQRFCSACGQALDAAAAPAPAASEAVERRLVSVLFADLVSFTAYTEARDAEDVRTMLAQYFEAARRVVNAYGGTIEKFIGDAVMAVWGAPVAREDDAERAVRAALDLVAAVAAVGEAAGVELRARAGVLTGEAAVALHVAGQGMVVGDTVNTASRIQSLAPPGAVLVDDVTHWITHAAIAYDDAGSHAVKGKAEAVRTWRALRVLGGLRGVGRDVVEPPLVGREAEMRALRAALDALLESGTAQQIVTLVGEAGLGKSRLAWELEKYVDGIAARVLWHRGQARSFGEGTGFSALADMVRMRTGITQQEPDDLQSAKVDALLSDNFAGDPAVARLRPALRLLLGIDSDGNHLERGELFSAWRHFFEGLAERRPVVLVFEDLHWADSGLFDFIEHLADWAPSARLLILIFSRPDDRLDKLALRGQRIELAPMADTEIEELVGRSLAGAPEQLVATVRDHAGGVPLFAVEVLRMLADRGVMVPEERTGRYRLSGVEYTLEVPASIHALIAARLDALGELERRMLLDGAVLGRPFAAGTAAALAGINERDARSLLDGLVSKQLLTVDRDPRSPQRGHYTFAHRQVQRVALSTISKRERRRLHLAAIASLSVDSADADHAALLAGHLLAAVEADPDAADAADIKQRALVTVLEAAHRAESVGALEQAAALYDRAAAIEPDLQRRARHLEHAARCLETIDAHPQGPAERYAKAAALQASLGNVREAALLHARELATYRYERPAAQLVGPLQEVYQTLQEDRDSAFAYAADVLSYVLSRCGDPIRAEALATEAIDAARAVSDDHALCRALDSRAAALTAMCRQRDGLDLFRAAAELADRRVPSRVSTAWGNLGYSLCNVGELREAEAALRRALVAAEMSSNRPDHNYATVLLGRVAFLRGDWDQALELVRSAGYHGSTMEGMALGPPLLIAINRGDDDRAAALLQEFDHQQDGAEAVAIDDYRCVREAVLAHLEADSGRAVDLLARTRTWEWAECSEWLPLAVAEVLRGDDGPGLRAAYAALERSGSPVEQCVPAVQLQRLAAHIALRDGDPSSALDHWGSATRIADDAGMAFEAAVLRLELAEHSPAAGAELERALETFMRLGAAPWQARAGAATHASSA